MRTLQRFYTITDAINLRHCLEVEGIDSMLGGESLGGIVGTPYSVNLLHESDFPKAKVVARKCTSPSSTEQED